jgi:hypothetical protein
LKADCKLRPLGTAAIKEKIVVHAHHGGAATSTVVMILPRFYEAEFLGLSFGSDRGEVSAMRWTR